jgi:O-antigen ligase
MATKSEEKPKRGLGTFKLSLIVIVLLLIPTTMEQLSTHQDTVRAVGRVCVGIALLFFFYGLLSKVLRFAGVILLVLIVARVLANEGVVEVPRLLEKREQLKEEREQRR